MAARLSPAARRLSQLSDRDQGGIIDANSNFVNCKGEEGRFVVVTSTSASVSFTMKDHLSGTESKTLRITEVEVWEEISRRLQTANTAKDQVLTRSGGAAAGSIGLVRVIKAFEHSH